jgi:hypothetical protein
VQESLALLEKFPNTYYFICKNGGGARIFLNISNVDVVVIILYLPYGLAIPKK